MIQNVAGIGGDGSPGMEIESATVCAVSGTKPPSAGSESGSGMNGWTGDSGIVCCNSREAATASAA